MSENNETHAEGETLMRDEAMSDEQIRTEFIRFALLQYAYDHSEAKNNGEAIAWLKANVAEERVNLLIKAVDEGLEHMRRRTSRLQ